MTTETSGGQIPVETEAPELNRKTETRIYYRKHMTPTIYKVESYQEGALVKTRKTKEVLEESREVWIATDLLPADAYNMNRYIQKGFKLWPPGEEPEGLESVHLQATHGAKSVAITCPVEDCPFIGKTYLGLARHMAKKHGRK